MSILLPITPRDLIHQVIVPALQLFPVGYDSRDARCALVAIAKQESDLQHLRQLHGPACSLWQFERTGVIGVTQSYKVDDLAALACREARIACAASDVMRRIATPQGQTLACQLARLNLWKDPHSLPVADLVSEDQAWHLYLRTWRPGAARDPASTRYAEARERWTTSWRVAVEAVDP
jgi:hypothetical protein